MYLRKENGQFNGSEITAEFTLMQKLAGTFGIALLLVLVSLIIGNYVIHYVTVVKEVWANMDNAAYTNYVRGTSTTTEEPAVVMDRVAKCESGGHQFTSKGVLITHINKDGSIDVGKFMINNTRHEAQAVKLGFNIYSEGGNTGYAYHLYETQGTEPWIHSKSCWVK
jgi:hypothetical protein